MSFKWSDCGNSSSKILFKDFKLTPDPVVLPGSIKVSAGIEIKEDILNSLSVCNIFFSYYPNDKKNRFLYFYLAESKVLQYFGMC